MMDFYLINVIFIFLVNVTGILLVLWVLAADGSAKLNRYFSLMTLFILVWINLVYLSDLPSQMANALILNRLIVAAVFSVFVSFYFFSIYFPKEEKRIPILDSAVLILGVIFAFAAIFTDFFCREVRFNDWGTEIVFGQGMNIFFGMVILQTIFIVIRLLKKYYQSSQVERIKMEYFLAGIIISVTLNVIFNIVLAPSWSYFPYYYFGNYSLIILLVFIAYAVARHNLMGVKTFITQIIVAIMSIVLVVDILFLSDNFSFRVFKVFVLATFLYFSRELVRSIKREQKILERVEQANLRLAERNKDLGVLLEAGSRIGQELNSKKTAQDIVDGISKNLEYLGYIMGVIVLYDDNSGCITIYAITNSAVNRMEEAGGIHVEKFVKRISVSGDLMVKTVKERKTFVSGKMEDFFGGFMAEEKNKQVQKIIKAKSFVSVPLFAAGKVLGAIVFANNKKPEEITQRSKNIIWAFASHIGSAIENAQLYEKTNVQMKELSVLNKDLKKANTRLKELLEIKNEFLHITSHQLRTPLTAIRGMIAMWIEGDYDKLPLGEKNEMLRRIYISTERLNNVTNDMLDALELEGGVLKFDFKKVSLIEMLKDVMFTLHADYDKKGLYLRFGKVDNSIPEIEAEPNYMSQVFMNLVDNACKYTRTGGVEIDVINSGKYVDVYVKDTGIGMDEKDVAKAFDKFTRGKDAMVENASGSGLGLFIVKKIMQQHNGNVSVQSAGSGKGATFKVSVLVKQE